VEDSSAVLELSRLTLTQQGYTVLTADSGSNALEVWRNQSGPIDLLLTDIVMPGGMSGFDLAAQLIGEKPDLKVIFSTGYSPDFNETARKTWSAFKILQKPCPLGELVRAVQETIQSRSFPEEGGG